jgi:hypothetical protein
VKLKLNLGIVSAGSSDSTKKVVAASSAKRVPALVGISNIAPAAPVEVHSSSSGMEFGVFSLI